MICAFVGVDAAPAQQAMMGCSSEHSSNTVQILRCRGGVTIIAEDGAKFTLQDRDKNGAVDSVNLQSKALLVDAPKQRGKKSFEVTTPQAIAAVRGTKWAVDVQETRTSVLVARARSRCEAPPAPTRSFLAPAMGSMSIPEPLLSSSSAGRSRALLR